MTRLALVILILVAVPVSAGANGGPTETAYIPDAQPLYGAAGGLVVMKDSDIGLVAERLRIALLSGRMLWRARAEYVLSNPGAARTVGFAVPMRWSGEALGYRTPGFPQPSEDLLKEAKMGAASIAIGVGGRTTGCELKVERRPDGNVWDGRSQEVEGWCVTSLQVPRGNRIPVTLEYLQGMVEVDHGEQGARQQRLRYPLWPAGYWKGPVRKLSVEVDLGGYSGAAMVVAPPNGNMSDRFVTWDFEGVDLKTLGDVIVDVRTLPKDPFRDAGWVRREAQLSAAASSELKAEGRFTFQASNAIDGRLDTAWCEGVEGDGKGESLKVWWSAVDAPPGSECEVRDVVLVPGYARDEHTYLGNGRLERTRIDRCDESSPGLEARLLPRGVGYEYVPDLVWRKSRRDDWREPPQELRVPSGALPGARGCVRMTIVSARPGARFHDTCVSEFTPRVYCRGEARQPAAQPEPTAPAAVTLEKDSKAACASSSSRRCPTKWGNVIDSVLSGKPGFWRRLVAACGECVCSRGDAGARPLSLRRCELALRLEEEDAALRLRRGVAAPDDEVLADILRVRLLRAQNAEKMELLCVGSACPE